MEERKTKSGKNSSFICEVSQRVIDKGLASAEILHPREVYIQGINFRLSSFTHVSQSLSTMMSRSLDASQAAWLYPLRVCPALRNYSSVSVLTNILGSLLLLIASIPLAVIPHSSSPNHPPFNLHLHHPLPIRLPSPSCIPGHLPRRRRMDQRRIPRSGRRSRHCSRIIRSFLRR